MTTYAADLAAEDLGWDRTDILLLLDELEVRDFHRVEDSTARPGDLIWVFCPDLSTGMLWIRLVEREEIVVVSFHRA